MYARRHSLATGGNSKEHLLEAKTNPPDTQQTMKPEAPSGSGGCEGIPSQRKMGSWRKARVVGPESQD